MERFTTIEQILSHHFSNKNEIPKGSRVLKSTRIEQAIYEDLHNAWKVPELTCRQNVNKLKRADDVGEKSGVSGRQIQRYIRLTKLIDPLLAKVDKGMIPVTAGAELSYLKVKPQLILNDVMNKEDCKISLKQALQMRQKAKEELLSAQIIEQILLEDKRTEKIIISMNRLKKYFPNEYSLKQCEEKLWEILDKWFNQQK